MRLKGFCNVQNKTVTFLDCQECWETDRKTGYKFTRAHCWEERQKELKIKNKNNP
jgi:hypothetical protein